MTRVVRTSCRVLKALQRKYCITKNYDALRVEIGLQIYFRLRREETAGNMFVTCTRYASFPELSLSLDPKEEVEDFREFFISVGCKS